MDRGEQPLNLRLTAIQTKAIILKTIPYEERHQIVTALSETHGLVKAVARNAIQSRRFGGALQLFTASELEWTQREGADLGHLVSAQVLRSFEGLRTDFARLALASAFNEIILRLSPSGATCAELFKLHANALAILEESLLPERQLSLLNCYLAKILQWNGNQPQVRSCLRCKMPLMEVSGEWVNVHATEAGWTCKSCEALPSEVPTAAMKDLAIALAFSLKHAVAEMTADAAIQSALYLYLESLSVFHVPGFDRAPFKSLKFLNLPKSSQQLH